jgi:hypothetical protein
MTIHGRPAMTMSGFAADPAEYATMPLVFGVA